MRAAASFIVCLGLLSSSCSRDYIPNTDVEETDFNRNVVEFCEEYRHAVERRNLVGLGFQTNSDLAKIAGRPLPNIEYPAERLQAWSDKPRPAGFGIIGRN